MLPPRHNTPPNARMCHEKNFLVITTPTQPQLNSKVGFDIKMTLVHHRPPTLQELSCYWPNFDQTLTVGFWDQQQHNKINNNNINSNNIKNNNNNKISSINDLILTTTTRSTTTTSTRTTTTTTFLGCDQIEINLVIEDYQ